MKSVRWGGGAGGGCFVGASRPLPRPLACGFSPSAVPWVATLQHLSRHQHRPTPQPLPHYLRHCRHHSLLPALFRLSLRRRGRRGRQPVQPEQSGVLRRAFTRFFTHEPQVISHWSARGIRAQGSLHTSLPRDWRQCGVAPGREGRDAPTGRGSLWGLTPSWPST